MLKVKGFEKEVKILLKKYSEEELLSEAIKALFEVNPRLRLEVAKELYKEGEVSLEKAAEIAGLGVIEFREIISRDLGRIVESEDLKGKIKKLEKYL